MNSGFLDDVVKNSKTFSDNFVTIISYICNENQQKQINDFHKQMLLANLSKAPDPHETN
jgi:hypothetical protein